MALGVTHEAFTIVLEESGTARVAVIDRQSSHICVAESLAVAGSRGITAVVGREGWGAYALEGNALHGVFAAHAVAERSDVALTFAAPPSVEPTVRTCVLEGIPVIAAAWAVRADSSSLAVTVVPGNGETAIVTECAAPSTSRHLVAATVNAAGPACIFETDRPDEIDVVAWHHSGSTLERTVSLGYQQRFVAAAGGGTRIFIVSRGPRNLVVRTLASDVRSELNPAPITPPQGWEIGSVHCAYANGPFVLAHGESREGVHFVVVTAFDGVDVHSHRIELPQLDALAVEGKDVLAAALSAGASTTRLLIHRMSADGSRTRRYGFLLEEPALKTEGQRRAVLLDLAEMLSFALGVVGERLEFHTHDEASDVVTMRIPGDRSTREVALAVLARADGTGVASLRSGHGDAPEPGALHFAERLREFFTGDDDGDPTTIRIELPHVVSSMDAIVAAVGATRAAHAATRE